MVIKGIAWDHPRGLNPQLEAARMFKEKFHDIDVQWTTRSLEDLADLPISSLIDKYDLIMVDHPYMGEAHTTNLFIPLNKYLSDDDIAIRRKESVGQSFDSYYYGGNLYAMDCDSASQVSAFLMEKVKIDQIPKDWDELLSFAKNNVIGVPLGHMDMWCTMLTLVAQLSNKNVFNDNGINTECAEEAIRLIYQLLEISHPISINSNPIRLLDEMAANQEIVYSPFIFSYSNYSRKSCAHPIKFVDIFSLSDEPTALLGGVGTGISSQTSFVKECVEYIKFVSNPDFQAKEYYTSGGQPGYMTAWDNQWINDDSFNFFRDTYKTIKNAYKRPQYPGWNRFQDQGSHYIHESMQKKVSEKTIIKDLNNMYESLVIRE